MIPLPWFVLRRRAVDRARWRAASPSATPERAAAWREDRFEGVARGVGLDGFGRVREALLTYDLFPPDRVTGTVDTTDGRLALGATVVQRVRVGFIGFESGTRVVGLADGSDELGRRSVRCSYATLTGHPEQGMATFAAAETGDGTVTVSIVTLSRAAAWWARSALPLTRRLQVQTNQRVIERLVAIASGDRSAAGQPSPGSS